MAVNGNTITLKMDGHTLGGLVTTLTPEWNGIEIAAASTAQGKEGTADLSNFIISSAS